MDKILNTKHLPLIAILIFGFIIFTPIISYFPEGDDLLFLWHIRVPVSILNLPFYGWEEPIAGRFGYGQAWYGATIYKLFGFQLEVFNFFGIICRLIATFAIYKFCINLTGRKIIGLLSALIYTIISTGINGVVNLFLHFSFVFLSIFLFGSYKLVQGLEEKSRPKVFIGIVSLLIGNYLYTIRAIGITLIPLWVISRIVLYTSYKHKFISFFIAIMVVVTSIYMVTNFIPGASGYASETLFKNSNAIFNTVQKGNYEYLRSLIVSSGLMFFPRSFYNQFNEIFLADMHPNRYLLFWSPLLWALIYLLFSIPTLFTKNKKILIIFILGLVMGILWNFLLFYLKKEGVTLFYGGEIVTATLGIYFYLLGIFVGLLNLIRTPKLGSVIISATIASLLFYIPNWLHDPVIISSTESRYFTVSAGFISITIGTLISLLIIFADNLNKKTNFFKNLRYFYIILSLIFAFTVIYYHLTSTNKILLENKSIRISAIITNHWNYVSSRVDFNKRPIVVVVWAGTQIDNAKREFFRHQSLGLIGDLPWDYNLTDQIKLFYSYEDSANAICGWKNRGIGFDYNNFYEFKLTDEREIIDRSREGRERIKTWEDFCSDPTKKGIEVST